MRILVSLQLHIPCQEGLTFIVFKLSLVAFFDFGVLVLKYMIHKVPVYRSWQRYSS